jgi:hypothetical protein
MLRGIILSLAFFLAFETFLAVPSWQSPLRLLLPALLGVFVAILSTPWFEEAEPFEGRRATLALLAAETSMVLTVLPLAAAHKAAVFLLLSVVLLETGNASESEKGLESALALFALLFFLSAALFTVARWGI